MFVYVLLVELYSRSELTFPHRHRSSGFLTAPPLYFSLTFQLCFCALSLCVCLVPAHSSHFYVVYGKIMILVMSVCLFTGGCFPCDHYSCSNLSVWDPSFRPYYMGTSQPYKNPPPTWTFLDLFTWKAPPPGPMVNNFWNRSILIGISTNMNQSNLGYPYQNGKTISSLSFSLQISSEWFSLELRTFLIYWYGRSNF